MDDSKAIEVNDGIYWVGFSDENAGFSNNPYLLIEGESVVLFDPGSRLPEHFEIVKKKIESVIPIEKITMIVVHHQDPDLCASIPLFEEIIGVNNFELIATMRTSLLLPYYGIRTEITTVEDGDILELDNGREIMFITSPYLHFAGAHVSYDMKTKTMFSSDIFAAFSADWNLYANENYTEAMRIFHEPYIAHKSAIDSFANKIKDIELKMICPQHGSVIKEESISRCMEALLSFEVGSWLI
ncbi:Anaerobic nitric oxide reductase flavorubredoxin [Candidatus Lokiarchaeum ossiferum]|uniref:Anaerobic nitric oxide reductase flavorubredoxin n=1 Tax=Candidatus Lokiarchaeum ossiferum TaxID=2951803 RepID=A0ABY6HYS2_9ARCH|nr:Anaerobic nitric oxide reductase flavorubredoxin [Candidatus Lokiarchaeum sp. B-35]